MAFLVPLNFCEVIKRYIKEHCIDSVQRGTTEFLKNWSIKGQCQILNTGKYTIKKLHHCMQSPQDFPKGI